MEQPEYAGASFGAISLLGDEQAQKIQQFILHKISPAIIEERRILCGNASHFQGDERNVIFLSMVDSNETDGPLSLAGEGAGQSRKQRYNVAASRAKDQLWVVHSLDLSRDLKPGDIRRDMLEYANNPKAFSQLVTAVEAAAESPFEEAVGKSLVAAGYNLVQQWEVGAYRIDMVAIYKGNRVAIECDGEQYHSGEETVRQDMERQTILERLGWRFIRIRGSEYYRHPGKNHRTGDSRAERLWNLSGKLHGGTPKGRAVFRLAITDKNTGGTNTRQLADAACGRGRVCRRNRVDYYYSLSGKPIASGSCKRSRSKLSGSRKYACRVAKPKPGFPSRFIRK